MTFRHKVTGEELQYQTQQGSNLMTCPHGNQVAYSDECDDCMREYE